VSAPHPVVQNVGQSRPDLTDLLQDRRPALLTKISHVVERSNFRTIGRQSPIKERGEDRDAIPACILGIHQMLLENFAGPAIALEDQILLVVEIIVERSARHPEFFGNRGQRNRGNAYAIEGTRRHLEHTHPP